MSAGRLNTLTATYQNLRGFCRFKNAETIVKKSQYNQTLKETKEGKKTLNTVYIKYEEHTKIDKTDNDGVAVKNYTFTATGDENDIRKAIKEFISFAIKMPYVLKVLTKRVTINKDEKDTDHQRWQREEEKMMEVLNNIKYRP